MGTIQNLKNTPVPESIEGCKEWLQKHLGDLQRIETATNGFLERPLNTTSQTQLQNTASSLRDQICAANALKDRFQSDDDETFDLKSAQENCERLKRWYQETIGKWTKGETAQEIKADSDPLRNRYYR